MKRIKILIMETIVILLVIFLSGCGNTNKKEYIGIISAMDSEIDMLLSETRIERIDKIGGEDYHVGSLCGKSVIICKAGIGKIRSSSGVTTLLNTYNIKEIIFTGIAGGVADETNVLDEIIATNVVEHDYGIVTNEGFSWLSGNPGTGGEEGIYYECDKRLVEIAYNAALETLDGKYNVFKGTIATGDQFVASEILVERLKNEYNAYACEMEGAAIAAVCINYKTPFVIIRALSDKADGNAHETYEGFADIAALNSSKIVLKMLENL